MSCGPGCTKTVRAIARVEMDSGSVGVALCVVCGKVFSSSPKLEPEEVIAVVVQARAAYLQSNKAASRLTLHKTVKSEVN